MKIQKKSKTNPKKDNKTTTIQKIKKKHQHTTSNMSCVFWLFGLLQFLLSFLFDCWWFLIDLFHTSDEIIGFGWMFDSCWLNFNQLELKWIQLCWSWLDYADFNLSGGCFGTDILQKYTKLSKIRVHGPIFGPIFAKFQCASFLLRKNVEKWQYGPTKHKMSFFVKKSFRSYMPHTKRGKKNVPI